MPPQPHPKRAAIAQLLREGLTHLEIAARLDVSVPLVGKVARVEKLTRSQGRRPGGKREAVLALATRGVASDKIALTLECSKRLVDTYLLEERRNKEREAVLTLAAEGVTSGEIALTLECSKRLVDTYLLEEHRRHPTRQHQRGAHARRAPASARQHR